MSWNVAIAKRAGGVVMINPKFPHNVGAALRACHCHHAEFLRFTGDRVKHVEGAGSGRLPREERMREYRAFDFKHALNGNWLLPPCGWTPVVVECLSDAEDLFTFEHPHRAVYIFGPEDGSVPKGVRHAAHRFVKIDTKTCLNLAMAIGTVLYDRRLKERTK